MSHVFWGNKRRTHGLSVNTDELVEGQHMSECSGSDTVFIALPLTHFGEVWIECRLTKGLFPPKISQVQPETFGISLNSD